MLVLVGIASNAEQFEPGADRAPPTRSVSPIQGDVAEIEQETPELFEEPVELPQWTVVALSIVFGVGGLYLLSKQRINWTFRRPSIQITRSPDIEVSEEEQAEAIADLARDLIDELNEGDSARYAIQRAYAAVETGFGSTELARKEAETPLRYLDRIFGRHSQMEEPLAQLTSLFQHARFSDEPVDESMRHQAIEALTEIRDYYQSVAWAKISRRSARAKA